MNPEGGGDMPTVVVVNNLEGTMVIRTRLRGRHACWTPLCSRAERTTSSAPSHEALRGLFRRVLSKTAFDYSISKLILLSEPRRQPITSNEFKFNNVGIKPVLAVNGQHTQRTTVFLKNPDYLVEFSLVLTGKSERPQDTIEKYYAMFLRRAKRGQTEKHPVLGITECPARLDLVEDHELAALPPPVEWTEDLGISFFGADWDEGLNYFFPLKISKGVLEYPSWDEVRSFGVTKAIGRIAS